MRYLPALVLFFFLGLAFAQAGSESSEGGNVTATNVSADRPSIWHGICGQAHGDPFSPETLNATPGDITCLDLDLGFEDECNGTGFINIMWSNSSEKIISLVRGNITLLDEFINDEAQDGTRTLVFSRAYPTRVSGTVTGVPSTYTFAPDPTEFPMGYMNDQSGNLVFITRIYNNKPGFNGSFFDFQMMVPTYNATPTLWYLTADFKCKKPYVKGGGGGGSGVPVYNESRAPTPPPEVPPEGIPGFPAANETICDIVLYCEEWGPCQDDGFRYQSCIDLTNCSDIEVFRVEECPVEPEKPPSLIPEEIIPIYVEPESPCCPLAVLALIIVIIIFIIWKRRKKKKAMPE